MAREPLRAVAHLNPTAEIIAARLNKAKRTNAGWIACCPAHEDGTPSLSIADGEKGPVFKCHAGCTQESVLNAIEALGVQIRRPKTNGNCHHDAQSIMTIEDLQASKYITAATCEENHVGENERGVCFNYIDADGASLGTKYRKYLWDGVDGRGFAWSANSKRSLYGLWRLEKDLANDGRIILCEGETDALTLWQRGYTALALPGASMWQDDWSRHFPESSKVYVILEPDKGGATVEAALEKSPLRKRIHFVRMPEHAKDPNALHSSDPDGFDEKFDKLIAEAAPLIGTKLRGVKLRDMSLHLNNAYVVKGIVPARAEGWIIGSSGTGKTFFTTDLALHIAHNKPYRGKRVRGGLVVYFGCENPISIERRFRSAGEHTGLGLDAPLEMCPGPIDLRSPESVADVIEYIKAAEIEHGQKCVCVFVDTLARAGGGKEDAEDFGAAIKGADAIRDQVGTSILVVHHLGKDTERGGRGHSSFLGGVDIEITITEEGDNKIATLTKVRDGREGERLPYKLRSVDIGKDDDGDQVPMCVVDHFDADSIPVQLKRPNGKAQSQLLAELERRAQAGELAVWAEGELREIAREIGQHKATARSAVLGLRQLGYFRPSVGGSKLIFVPKDTPNSKGNAGEG